MVHFTRKFFVLVALTGIVTTASASTRVAIDNSQTSVGFVCNSGLVAVTGNFTEVRGIVEIDVDAPSRSKVRATIGSRSLTTGQAVIDSQLKGSSFFDASAHPTFVFTSSAVLGTPVSQSQIMGELTIKEITRAVTLEVTLEPPDASVRRSNAGKTKLTDADRIFRATTQIRRSDFGMTGYDLLVGDQCEIQIVVALDAPGTE